jgi:hypothetical protein
MRPAAMSPLPPGPGLHPLAPYFTKFVADEITAGLRSLSTLHTVLRVVSALLANPHMQLQHYVHQLLPPVLTCLVAKSLGGSVGPPWVRIHDPTMDTSRRCSDVRRVLNGA